MVKPAPHRAAPLRLEHAAFFMAAALLCAPALVTAQEAEPAAVDDQTMAEPAPQQAPVMNQRQLYCLQLEQRLRREARGAQQARDSLPKIDAEIARTNRQYQQAQNQAETLDCYDYFLFSKDWRNTPRCNKVRQQIDGAKKRIDQLRAQRDQTSDGQVEQTKQDALITELARNSCGPQYSREAQKRANHNTFFWNDSEGDPGFGANSVPQPTYSTYRTLCVRTCDGYYYPISYAATQVSFQRDADLCQAKCAAPARLFIYQNPGAEIEQAMSVDGGVAYSRMPNAFRYRRELVKGCSCNQAEYVPKDGDVPVTASIAPVAGGVETGPLAEANTVSGDAASSLFQGDEPVVPVVKPKVRKKPRVESAAPNVSDLPKFMQ
jgi:Protein of unknown function (DUF2865)